MISSEVARLLAEEDPSRKTLTREEILAAFEAARERDPNDKPPGQPGVKLDAGKSPVRRGLLEQFPRACMAVADVSKYGADKYCWNGWETVPDGINRYGDAEVRHICYAAIEGPAAALDMSSKLLHAAHEAWNAFARLEMICRELEGSNAKS